MKKITIAIDGHSSCGKSTLAKDLAKELDYIYVDSGAMYRAVTLFFIQNNIDLKDQDAIMKALALIEIKFVQSPDGRHTLLNGVDVEQEIRTMEVSRLVSPVAAISSVRKKLVEQQQAMGIEKGMVMDGRDIGTVVFPDAELKIFLTADNEVRAQRRFEELKAKGQDISLEEVAKNLLERDHIDSNRADSPLMKAERAVVIDNSYLSRTEQFLMLVALVKTRAKNLILSS